MTELEQAKKNLQKLKWKYKYQLFQLVIDIVFPISVLALVIIALIDIQRGNWKSVAQAAILFLSIAALRAGKRE